MIPLNCITRVVAHTSTSLPRFVTQFHHPTRTKDHPTRAKKEIQQMRKKKQLDEYILLRKRFLAPPLLILLFGLQNNQRETKERRFWCKKTKLTSTPLSLSFCSFYDSLSTSQFLPFGGYCTVTMNQKANVSKELNARHRKVSLPSLIEISILPLPVLDCFCVNLDFFFILIILSRFELNGD